jgi:hypothetical protein
MRDIPVFVLPVRRIRSPCKLERAEVHARAGQRSRDGEISVDTLCVARPATFEATVVIFVLGDAMLTHLEKDFADQQQMLVILRAQRRRLEEGCEVANEYDRKIMVAENLILSYEALKWYER